MSWVFFAFSNLTNLISSERGTVLPSVVSPRLSRCAHRSRIYSSSCYRGQTQSSYHPPSLPSFPLLSPQFIISVLLCLCDRVDLAAQGVSLCDGEELERAIPRSQKPATSTSISFDRNFVPTVYHQLIREYRNQGVSLLRQWCLLDQDTSVGTLWQQHSLSSS